MFTFVSLAVLLAVILIKFFLAAYFNWTMSRKLGKALPPPPDYKELDKEPEVLPAVAKAKENSLLANRASVILPTKSRYSLQYNSHQIHQTSKRLSVAQTSSKSSLSSVKRDSLTVDNIAGIDPSGILRTIMLVTCYSEDEAGIRTTLDSLARTTFPDTHKMLFIIADGIIMGSGNSKSTPDILIDMIDMDPQFEYPPPPYSYVAIADGMKRHNMARVYAGRYHVEGYSIPTILVVKCGTLEEQTMPKPGNRGKRDSQILLMQFLSKVLFDDRMTTLEFDLFTKMTAVSSLPANVPLDLIEKRVTPDLYELVLMVVSWSCILS